MSDGALRAEQFGNRQQQAREQYNDTIPRSNAPNAVSATARQYQQMSPQVARIIDETGGDPQTIDRINASAYLAQTLDLDVGDVYRNFDSYVQSYIGKSQDPSTAWGAMRREFEIGTYQVRLGQIGRALLLDPDNDALLAELDGIMANMPTPEELRRSLPAEVMKAVSNQLPFMMATQSTGFREGISGALAGATVAGIAGQAGPQILLPEEIVTIPAGAIAGYQIGQRVGRTAEAASLSSGFIASGAIARARAEGAEINQAAVRAFAAAGGVLSGLIENTQLDTIFGGNKQFANIVQREAMRAIQKEMVTNFATNRILQVGKRALWNWGSEIVQEVVQESVEFISEELTVAVTNAADDAGIPASTIGDYGALLRETIRQSALAFAPMTIPSSVSQGITSANSQRDVRARLNSISEGPMGGAMADLVSNGFFETATDQQAESMLQALTEAEGVRYEDVSFDIDSGVVSAKGNTLATVDISVSDGVVTISDVDVRATEAQAPALRKMVAEIQSQNPDTRIVFDRTDENAAAIERAIEEQNPDVARIWEDIDVFSDAVADITEQLQEVETEIAALSDIETDEDTTARAEELSAQRESQQSAREAAMARLERLEQIKEQYRGTDTREDWQISQEEAAVREGADENIDSLDWSQTPRSNRLRRQLEDAGFSAGEVEAITRLREQRASALGVDPDELPNLDVRRGATPEMTAESRARGEDVNAAFDPTRYAEEGEYIIWLTENATFRDVVHELGHYFRRTLTDAERQRIEKHTGAFVNPDGTVNVEAEERWAWHIEGYIYDGRTEIAELRPILERAAQFIRKFFKTIAEVIDLKPEMRAEIESVFGRPAEAPRTTAFDSSYVEVREVPVSSIRLSEDVPQFKENAEEATGVVDELDAARYERLGTAPIVVWERSNGNLEVITGRHRLDLARRLGEETIPAQVVREDDGFTREQAATFDAEANIRDGQGSVRDYANYFRNTEIDQQEASSRGLLSRDKGVKGFEIGRHATDALYTLYRNNQINQTKAAAIARSAPGDDAAQAEGIRRHRDMTGEELENYVKIVASMDSDNATQQDMFGNSDGSMQQAMQLAQNVTEHRRDLRVEAQTLTQALKLTGDKRTQILSQYGSADFDETAIRGRLTQLAVAIARWSEWTTDPDLAQYARDGFLGDDPATIIPDSGKQDSSQESLFSTPYFSKKQIEKWREQIYEDDAEVARFMGYTPEERAAQTAEADALIDAISDFSEDGTLYRVNGGLVEYVLLHKAFPHEKSRYRASMFDRNMRPVMHSIDDSFGRLYKKADEFIRDVFSQFRPVGVVDADAMSEQPQRPRQLTLFSTAPPTDSPAFRKWFGDSKVVDESGKPKVVYTGSPMAGFAEFSDEGLGISEGTGVWLTDNIDVAASYAGTDALVSPKSFDEQIKTLERREMEMGAVKISYFASENESISIFEPLDPGESWTGRLVLEGDAVEVSGATQQEVIDALREEVENSSDIAPEGPGIYANYLSMQNPVVFNSDGRRWDKAVAMDGGKFHISTNDAVLMVKEENPDADGVIFENVHDGGDTPSTVYVAFSPEQIKSVNNRGTWSRSDDRMLYSTPVKPDYISAIPDAEKLTSPEAVAAHNTKVEIMRTLYEAGMFMGDALYEIKSDDISDWNYINEYLENAGEMRTAEEIYEEIYDDGLTAEDAETFDPGDDIFEIAKLDKGITDDIYEAGYVLPDGTMLDFSGKRSGADGGYRQEDHRQLGLIGDFFPDADSGTDSMLAFMAQGAVRIDAASQSADFSTVPTGPQMGVIQEFIEGGSIDVNTPNGTVSASVENWTKVKPTVAKALRGEPIEETLFMTPAWHGSPYAFDRFTLEAIGTGEGAQVFGWGLYFTSNEQIARHYADALDAAKRGRSDLKYKAVSSNLPTIAKIIAQRAAKTPDAASVLDAANSKEGMQKATIDVLVNYRWAYDDGTDERNLLESAIKAAESGDLIFEVLPERKPNRNLYRVRLFDGDYDPVWLDWSEKVTRAFDSEEDYNSLLSKLTAEVEQTPIEEKELLNKYRTPGIPDDEWETIKTAIIQEINEKPFKKIESMMEKWGNAFYTGESFYKDLSQFFLEATESQSPDKEASLFLLANGIDGIRYPAGSLSGGGEGTNYVVFDENAIQVEERIQFSTKHPEEVRAAIERFDPVPDEVLVQYQGEEWADSEIDRRREMPMREAAFPELFDMARAADTEEKFVATAEAEGFAGVEEMLKDIYHSVNVNGVNDGNRKWASSLKVDDIVKIAQQYPDASMPLTVIAQRAAKGTPPSERMLKTARGYLRNNGVEWRRRIAQDASDYEALARLQREQLQTISMAQATSAEIADAPAATRRRFDELARQAVALGIESISNGTMTAAEAAQAMAEYDAIVNDVRETRQRRDAAQARKRVAKQYRENMLSLGRVATRKLPRTIDARYRALIEEMQREVDPKFRSAKTLKLKSKRREWLKANPEAKGILRDSTVERIEQRSLDEWTEQELTEFVAEIQRLVKIGRNKYRIRQAQFEAQVESIVSDAIKAIPTNDAVERNILARDATWWDKKKRQARELFYANLRPWALIDMVDGGRGSYDGPMYRAMIEQMNEASAREVENAASREQIVHAKLKELGFSQQDMAAQRVYGGVQKMMRQEAIGIYAAEMNAQTRNYLLNGHGLTVSEIAAIIGDLSEAEKEVAHTIMQDYDHNKERLRDAHYTVANMMMEYVDHYIPIITVGRQYESHRQQLTEETLIRAGHMRARPQDGMTKSRVQRLRNPRKMRLDLYSVWHTQIRSQEHYIESAGLVKQLEKVLSNKQLQSKIEESFGPEMNRQLRGIKDRFANPAAFRSFDVMDKWFSGVRRNAAVAFLAANAVTALKQTVSIAYYAGDAGPGRLIGNYMYAASHFNQLRDYVYKKDPKQRDRGIDRAYEELKAMAEEGAAGRLKSGVVNLGMAPIQFMDALTILAGWKAVYDQSKESGMSEQEAIAKARNATQRTQPASMAYELSSTLASQNLKWFTQFSNQLSSMFTQAFYTIPSQARNGMIAQATAGTIALALSAYVMWALGARRPIPEDAEDAFDIFMNQMLAMVPVVGPVAAQARNGFSSEPTVLIPFQAAGGAIAALERGLSEDGLSEEQLERLAWDVFEGISVFAGIPYVVPRRVGNAVEDIQEGDPVWSSLLQNVAAGGKWYLSKEDQKDAEPWR